MSTYFLINKQTDLIENCVEWDGNQETWQPPENFLVLLGDIERTEIIWTWNEELQDWVQEETVGFGSIGETWDGEKFIEPKPTVNP